MPCCSSRPRGPSAWARRRRPRSPCSWPSGSRRHWLDSGAIASLLEPRNHAKAGSMQPKIAVRRLPHAEGLPLPAYETPGSAGMDLRAAVPEDEPLVLKPGARLMAPTGLAMAIPQGYEVQVRPRSGLAAKAGVACLDTPGAKDSDYRGEVKVLL